MAYFNERSDDDLDDFRLLHHDTNNDDLSQLSSIEQNMPLTNYLTDDDLQYLSRRHFTSDYAVDDNVDYAVERSFLGKDISADTTGDDISVLSQSKFFTEIERIEDNIAEINNIISSFNHESQNKLIKYVHKIVKKKVKLGGGNHVKSMGLERHSSRRRRHNNTMKHRRMKKPTTSAHRLWKRG